MLVCVIRLCFFTVLMVYVSLVMFCSQFELEYLLLEGHCFESTMGNPPRGLQITLGSESEPVQMDTIVMANLGYFQLKANPGAWILRLRQGRSSDIFDITRYYCGKKTNFIVKNTDCRISKRFFLGFQFRSKYVLLNIHLSNNLLFYFSGIIWNSMAS